MNRNILGLAIIFFLISLACGIVTPPTPIQPGVETIVAATFQALTAVPPPTQTALSGTLVSVNNISFTIPAEIGSGSQVETIAAVSPSDDMPWWGIAPSYHKYIIQGYPLSGTFHTQTIYVYPINEYLQVNAEMAKLFDGLKTILNSPSQPLPDNLPFLPAFNAGQMFHSNELTLKFQNGQGIRFLTQYGQAPYPVNNNGLFYTFQGLTDDGMYYVAAILPVNASFLPADGSPDTPLPADGVPFDWENFENTVKHFEQARQKLNSTDANAFTPTLTKLDELIQSIMIK
jgi:hypothetical protein